MDRPNYSASAESTFRECQRKWWWSYVHRWEPTESPEYFGVGTDWHGLLEAFDATGKMPTHAPTSKREAMLHAMFRAYVERWPESWKVVAAEQKIEMPLVDHEIQPVDGWNCKMFIDLLVEQNGDLWIVEHKTTSQDISPGADYWKRLPLDPQLTTYWMGCQYALDVEPAGIIYDVVHKPQHRPLSAKKTKGKPCIKKCPGAACERCQGTGWQDPPKDEPPESLENFRDRVYAAMREEPARYFARVPVRRLSSQIQQHMRSMATYARQKDSVLAAGYAPQNPDSCHRYGTCPFWAVCCAGPDATPGDIPGMFKQKVREVKEEESPF